MGRFKKNNPGCKCCGAPPCNCISIITSDCNSSTPDVFYYDLSMSGITNDTCSDCDTWNGDFKLCWDGNDTWRSAPSSLTHCGHSAGDPLYVLERTGGSYVLEAKGMGQKWAVATGSWNCAGTNVLAKGATVLTCSCPATATLDPCVECPECDPVTSAPARVQIDFTGIVNRCSTTAGTFKKCTDWNATFVLNRISNLCTYYFRNDSAWMLYCPGSPFGTGAYVTIWAGVVDYADGDYGWSVSMQINVINQQRFFIETWQWKQTGKFDCSTARTLSLTTDTDNLFCDWSGSSVTLTPL